MFRTLFGAWKSVEEVEESVHQASGLTSAQAKNIAYLLEGGPMTISDLAYARGVSRQSVQVAINDLVQIGYVRPEDNPRHKRARLLFVTPLGREKFEHAQQLEYEIIQRIFPDMPLADVESTIRVLRTVQERLSQSPEGER